MARFPGNDIISLVGDAPRFDLAESLGPSLRVADLQGVAPGGLADLSLGYGTVAGDAALRHSIAKSHDVDADDVVVTVGGMHALFLLAFTLCDRDDGAVVAGPVFPLARNALTAVGAAVRTLPFTFDSGYQPDLIEFRGLLSSRTKLVSLASPQNPSGVAIPTRTLRDIVALMREHAPQAWLVLDETYREAAYGSNPVSPSAVNLGPRVVVVASLSKCHGAPGLRIGWVITRDAVLREHLLTAKFNTVISCSPVDEALALDVLSRHDRIIGERRQRLAENLALTAEWVRRNAAQVEWVPPDAGALCCVRLRPSVFDDAAVEDFYAALARQGVRVGQGRWFGEAARVFRLGFGLPTSDDLGSAFECMSAALRQATPEAGESGRLS